MSSDGTPAAAFPGWTWRAWRREDLTAIHALVLVAQEADNPTERTSLEELGEFLASSTVDAEHDTLAAVAADGSVRAIGRVRLNPSAGALHNSWLGGMVHPHERGRGVGRVLMAWEIARLVDSHVHTRTPGHGPLRLRVYADEKNIGEHALARRFGLEPMRRFVEMVRPFAPDEVIETPAPPGIEIVPWSDELVEPARLVVNASFADHWGSTDVAPTAWAEDMAASAFRPQWSFLARDASTDEPVGVVISCAYEQDWVPQGFRSGYIGTLGTVRSHRGLGVACALVRKAMATFAVDGMAAAGLGVDTDSQTGALKLYRALGFTETEATVLYARDLVVP